MAYINLLPWRENKRQQQQREFIGIAVTVLLATAAVWGLIHLQVAGFIEGQEQRNSFLQAEIRKLDEQIKTIKSLDKTKNQLLARMNVIQELQSNRPLSVHLMDELVRTLPDGVHLNKFTQRGNELTMEGEAQSNARVSAYMRNIDSSLWLDNPRLQVVETVESGRSRVARFVLLATLKAAAPGEQADGQENR